MKIIPKLSLNTLLICFNAHKEHPLKIQSVKHIPGKIYAWFKEISIMKICAQGPIYMVPYMFYKEKFIHVLHIFTRVQGII